MMNMLYLLFFVSVVHPYWIPCTCNKNTPLIPGADVIINGLDITELATSIEKVYKSPIFQYSGKYSCLENIQNNICYIVPAELNIISIDSTNIYQIENLYETYYDHVQIYAESYTCSMSIGVPDFSMSVNYHQELYESEELLSTGYSYIGYAYYSEYMYSIIMPPAYVLKLDSTFELSLKMLPSIIITEQDNNMYNEFIESYGGYYLVIVVMGGSLHENQYVEEDYVQTYSMSETITEMQTGFNAELFNMNFGYYSNSSEYTISEQYADSSTYVLTCYGGNISLECGSNEWKLSIVDNPINTNVTSIPLYYLVTDDVDKYNSLKYKIDLYTSTGVLN